MGVVVEGVAVVYEEALAGESLVMHPVCNDSPAIGDPFFPAALIPKGNLWSCCYYSVQCSSFGQPPPPPFFLIITHTPHTFPLPPLAFSRLEVVKKFLLFQQFTQSPPSLSLSLSLSHLTVVMQMTFYVSKAPNEAYS